jgi:nucleotide-binding universal stress UspA family protein
MDAVPPRRIVVGVNGSAPSLAALRWAADEARAHAARVHVVRVWDQTRTQLAPYARRSGRPTAQDERAQARAQLTAAVTMAFGPTTPAGTSSELVDGLAANVLLDRAVDADLLVLGGAEQSTQTGPVQRACLRRAPCPVVIVGTDVIAVGNGAG